MKESIFSTVAMTLLGLATWAQNVNIPDANFKAYLVGNTSINTNSDTEIQVSEAIAYTGGLNCSYQGINDLTGIESFPNITSFTFEENYLTTIDLSQNTALTSISCYYSYYLTTLILGQNTALTVLDLAYSPYLVNLDLSFQTNLSILALDDCSSLSNLDVTQNTQLAYLYVPNCNLSTIDVSHNTLLSTFKCEGNNLSTLDVSANTNLGWFSCFDNNLSVLDVSNNTSMNNFQCQNNNLSILNMKNIAVNNGNQLAATGNPNLTCIDVDDVAASTLLWTNIDPGATFSSNCQVDLVASISIQGQDNVSTISSPGGTLQMLSAILPTYADNQSVTWSVTNGTGTASIDANGLLTALTDGTVTVSASANDGSGITGEAVITISNQTTSGISDQEMKQNITIFPNPASSYLTIQYDGQIESILIADLTGKTVELIPISPNTIDISTLPRGIYLIRLLTPLGISCQRFIKE